MTQNISVYVIVDDILLGYGRRVSLTGLSETEEFLTRKELGLAIL